MEFGFPREKRLTERVEFDNVFNKAQRIKSRCFIILYRENKLSTARLGVVLSKRKVKRATKRNQIRRILRESFRQYCPQLPPVDIVIIVNMMTTVDNQVLFKELEASWKRLIKC